MKYGNEAAGEGERSGRVPAPVQQETTVRLAGRSTVLL